MSMDDPRNGNDKQSGSGLSRFQFGLGPLLLVVLAWAMLLALGRCFGSFLVYWGLAVIFASLAAAALCGWRNHRIRQSFIGAIVSSVLPSGLLFLFLLSDLATLDAPIVTAPPFLAILGSVGLCGILAGASSGSDMGQSRSLLLLASAFAGGFGVAIPVAAFLFYEWVRQDWHSMFIFVGPPYILGAYVAGAIWGFVIGLVLKVLWYPKRWKVAVLLLGLTLVGYWLGYGQRFHTIATLEASGGRFGYHHEVSENGTDRLAVVSVSRPEHFRLLRRLPPIYSLSISFREVPQESFWRLDKLRGLRKLYICDSPISVDMLTHLRGLQQLEKLHVEKCPNISDDMLTHLRGLQQLEELHIEKCPNISGAGLKHLKGIPTLRALYLHDVPVENEDLVHLADLPHLEKLELYSKHIGDEGVKYLKVLHSLRWLLLGGTKVSDQGLVDLKRALPECTIYRYWTPDG